MNDHPFAQPFDNIEKAVRSFEDHARGDSSVDLAKIDLDMIARLARAGLPHVKAMHMVAQILKDIANGVWKVPALVSCTEVIFKGLDKNMLPFSIHIFNDVGSLDYVDRATFRDGFKELEYFYAEGLDMGLGLIEDPLSLLSTHEYAALGRMCGFK